MKPQPIRATPSAAPMPLEQPVWCEDLISIGDLGPSGVRTVLDLTALLKTRPADFRGALAGKQIALFFEKPSLRTRMTFEAGVHSLGGTSYFYDQTHARLGAREKLSDIAHNLERWIDGVVLRTFEHTTITELAQHSKIPVVNALSDLEHPCQALADYFTLQERFADLKTVKLAYVGDGNNVAHSLMLAAACTGGKISVATPAGYEPLPEIVDAARELATSTGAVITTTNDPEVALDQADAVYTDVWASMGQENQSDQRAAVFAPYQVNRKLFSRAAKHAVFMHCLPAHRGSEVTDSVIDSSRSVVFDQAENRLHAQKAVLLILLGGGVTRFSRRDGNA